MMDVDIRASDDGDTPLLRACYKGWVDCVRLLVDRGADVNAS